MDFPEDKIYGREAELIALMTAYDRIIARSVPCQSAEKKREIVLVRGHSGAGKTCLVNQVRWPLSLVGGYFVAAKFDQLGQVTPLAAFSGAMNSLCDMISKQSNEQARKAVRRALGTDSSILLNFMPSISNAVGVGNAGAETSGASFVGTESKDRIYFLFQTFLRAVSAIQPIIAFFDDLQWIDESSLELLKLLIADNEIRWMLIGAYRTNEVSVEHPFAMAVRSLESLGVGVTNIEVENMTGADVNNLIADVLGLSKNQTGDLSDIVHRKTQGLTLFVVQFIKSIHDQGLLRYSLSHRRWEWNAAEIDRTAVADDVVQLILSKMRRLPLSVMHWIKLASCFGFHCEEQVLTHLIGHTFGQSHSSCDPGDALSVGIKEGLLFKQNDHFMFAHDKIHDAAYSLVGGGDSAGRAAIHYQIASILSQNTPKNKLEDIIFIILEQYRMGMSAIFSPAQFNHNDDERMNIVELHLRGGQRAASMLSFAAACSYYSQGISLISEDDWKHYYNEVLEIHTCHVEALFVCGSFDLVEAFAQNVFAHSTCVVDKARAFAKNIDTMFIRGKPL